MLTSKASPLKVKEASSKIMYNFLKEKFWFLIYL